MTGSPGSPGLPEFRPPVERQAPAPRRARPGAKDEPPAGQAGQEWRKVARRLDRVAAELAALVRELPDADPGPGEAKAMRTSLGRISQHAGALKRRLGIGK